MTAGQRSRKDALDARILPPSLDGVKALARVPMRRRGYGSRQRLATSTTSAPMGAPTLMPSA